MADIKFTLIGETANFEQNMEDAMEKLRSLGSTMNLTAKELKDGFRELGKQSFEVGGEKAVEYFRQQVDISTQSVIELANQLNALEQTDGFDATSDEAKELTQALADAQERAAEFQAALDGAEKASQDQLANVAKNAKGLGDALNGLPGPMNGAVGGFRKLVTAAKAFIATPIGAIIGALVAALSLLKTYFTGTAEGQAKMAKASAVMGSVLDSVKDVAIKLGKALSEAFDNPVEAVKKLGKAIVDNLVNRIKGVQQMVTSLGGMLKSLFSADWDGLKQSAAEFADAQLKIYTGKGTEEWKERADKMKAWRDEVSATAEEMGKLATREFNLRKQRSKWQIKEAAMDEQIAKERMKAYDEEATPAERAEALANTQDLITKKYEKQIAFAQEEFAIVKKRNSLHESTLEDMEAENDLQANIVKLQAQMASELASVERRRATAAKQAKEEEFKRGQEAKSLEVQIGETRLEMQDESLKKQLESIELAKKRKQIELEAQKHEWEVAQHGKLTPEQEAYIKNMSALIDEAADAEANKVIFDQYADAAAKAFKEQAKFDDEAKLLEGKGVSTTEVRRQQNNAALAYMQSEEQEINPEFERWIESLTELTGKTLEGMLLNAEKKLAELESKGDATDAEVLEARARVAALRKELKAANKDINRGADVKKYENLNKVLGDAAKGFEALGQTGNEAFDSIMKDVSEVLTSVQSVVGNIQTLVTSSIEAEKQAAKEGASAVKAVEKASVILAIIGAALALAMKIKSMFADDGNRTEEVTKQVDALRNALRDLKREMALDVSQNDTIFGDNAYKNLMQYTQATKDYAKEYEKSVNEMALAGLESQRRGMKGQVETGWFGMQGKKEKADIDRMFDDIESQYKDRTLSLNESVELLMNNTLIQTQKRGWLGLRKEKYKALSEIAKDNGLSIIGGDDAETIQNLKALKESVSDLDDETKTAIDNMIADWETYNQALEGVKSTYTSWFGDMASTFADSIKLGFTDGAKAGRDNFKEQVNGMLSDMFLQLTIGKNMESIMGKYTDEIAKLQMQGASPTEIANTAAKAADEFLNNYDTSLKAYEDFQNQLEQRGFGIKDSIDGTLSGAIKGASQESIDLLSGYCNAVRIQQVDGINIMRDQLISLSGIERNTLNTNTILTAIRGDLALQFASDEVRAAG